ncbi:MAG: DUF4390 domain-containing protein [Curvibacter sp.]
MASITRCWSKARAELSALLACALLWGAMPLHAQPVAVEVSQLELRRSGEAVELSAALQFELPGPVLDALHKGLPVIFMAEAEIYRERWYWLDKRVAGAQRQMRLVYQPLTRRWRLSIGSGPGRPGEAGAALGQIFDSLDEALALIRRFVGWRIAEVGALEPGSTHRLEFRFRLDTAQLPRPLQIGTLGESDWVLAGSASRRLQPESLK